MIRCHDGVHQGIFQVLAGHTSPVIFNNTCWSAGEIVAFFLSSGARGYIGTLWSVGNDTATCAAQVFYTNAISGRIIDAVHEAVSGIRSAVDRDIYVYYGVHFTTLGAHVDQAGSLNAAFNILTHLLFQMIEQARKTESIEVKRNALEAVRRIRSDLTVNFRVVNMRELDRAIDEALSSVPTN
jgi:hypothetical protein